MPIPSHCYQGYVLADTGMLQLQATASLLLKFQLLYCYTTPIHLPVHPAPLSLLPDSSHWSQELLLGQFSALTGNLSRGISKHLPQALKVLPIIVWLVVYTEVIGMCIIGLVDNEDFQIPLVSLPPPCPIEALEPKGRSTDQGEIPAPHPPCCNGVWRAIALNLTSGIYCLNLTKLEH